MSSIYFKYEMRPSRLASDTFTGDKRGKSSARSALGTIIINTSPAENKSFNTQRKNSTLNIQGRYTINKNQTELVKGRKSNIIAPPKILGKWQHGSPGQYVNRHLKTKNKISVHIFYEI